jgi:protein-disulfide isomerase
MDKVHTRRAVLAGLGRLVGGAATLPFLSLAIEPAHAESIERPGDVGVGDPDAPIVMIEYFSLSCPHCAALHRLVFPTLKEKYIDHGKVHFVFRDFLLSRPAADAAILAHCDGPDRYFELQKFLFEIAREWNRPDGSLKILVRIGEEHGVDRDQFRDCLEEGTLEANVLASYQFATDKLGVDGTPTFFISGEKHVGGMSLETLSEELSQWLSADE